jgi:hypothetical protein
MHALKPVVKSDHTHPRIYRPPALTEFEHFAQWPEHEAARQWALYLPTELVGRYIDRRLRQPGNSLRDTVIHQDPEMVLVQRTSKTMKDRPQIRNDPDSDLVDHSARMLVS